MFMDLQVQDSSGLPLKHSRLARLMLAFTLDTMVTPQNAVPLQNSGG